MADRKVLVKYYPPDFDFDKLQAKKKALRVRQQQLKRRRGDVFDPPQKRHQNKVMNVRMMFPFTLKCGTCNEFIYVGTKFNSRVERVEGEDYLGIIKWRFYGRCPHCRAEVCFKTDPQNCDYVLEWGGTRMCDPLRDQELAAERVQKEVEEKLATDRVSQVEASRQGLQQEVLALEQLAELRRLNRRLMDKTAASDGALAFLRERRIKEEEGGLAGGQDWTEMEKDELKFFKAAREFDSDPESVGEERGLPNSVDAEDADLPSDVSGRASVNGVSASSGNSTCGISSSFSTGASVSAGSMSTSSSSSSSRSDQVKAYASPRSRTSANYCRPPEGTTSADGSASCINGRAPAASPMTSEDKGKVLNFGMGCCVSAPKLSIVKKQEPQLSGDCAALLEGYGSSSGEDGEAINI